MIITTTNTIEGKQIIEYKQLVFGEVVAGSNFIRDFFAGITKARKEALEELEKNAAALGANAVVGVEVNYTTITSDSKSMFMIVASGTAVVAR